VQDLPSSIFKSGRVAARLTEDEEQEYLKAARKDKEEYHKYLARVRKYNDKQREHRKKKHKQIMS